jgi:hypothetical protein
MEDMLNGVMKLLRSQCGSGPITFRVREQLERTAGDFIVLRVRYIRDGHIVVEGESTIIMGICDCACHSSHGLVMFMFLYAFGNRCADPMSSIRWFPQLHVLTTWRKTVH